MYDRLKINEKEADAEDFGEYVTVEYANCEYVCSDISFQPKKLTQETLNKYNIVGSEYSIICNFLQSIERGTCADCE
jgi:hypothetical protein